MAEPGMPLSRASAALAVATLTVLLVVIWTALQLSRSTDLDTDGFGQLSGAPDPDEGQLEEQLDWALAVVNGATVSDEEFAERFSPSFQAQITAELFEQESARIAVTGPYQLFGFQVDPGLGLGEAALLGADDMAYVLAITQDPDRPDQLAGLLITPVSAPRGAFSGWAFLLHAGAAVLLIGTGWLLSRFGQHGQGLLFGLAGGLWSAQLMEVAGSSLLFTVALVSGPVAAATLGTAIGWWRSGGLRWLVVGAVVSAAVAAVGPLLTIDTAAIGRPENLLGFIPDRELAEAAVRLSSGITLVALGVLVIGVLLHQFRLDWVRDRGQVIATFGILSAAVVSAVSAFGAVSSIDGYELSQPPTLSIGAMLVAVGISGSAFWDRYNEGSRAEELAEENELLQAQLALRLAEVQASRARIVQAGEEARRSVERDLHDGAQQRLVATLLSIRLGRQRFGSLDPELDAFLETTADDLGVAVGELRELARGLRPAVLEHGVAAAAEALAEVSPVPVTVNGSNSLRCSPITEQTAYYVISESLTNAARHAEANHVEVTITTATNTIPTDCVGIDVVIVDDGRGGATVGPGRGLQNLEDRVTAIGGEWTLSSPPGGPTTVEVSLPCGGQDDHGPVGES